MTVEANIVRTFSEGQPFALAGRPVSRSPVSKGAFAHTQDVAEKSETEIRLLKVDIESAYEQGRRAGLEEGYAQGLAAGRDAGIREADETFHRDHKAASEVSRLQAEAAAAKILKLDRMIQAATEQRSGFVADAEDDIVSLAFECLCRVLGEEFDGRDRIAADVRQTLANWRIASAVEIFLHPDDLDWLKESPELMSETEGQVRHPVQWTPDTGIELGGCRLGSSEGSLDARLELKLVRIGEALMGARAARKLEKGK